MKNSILKTLSYRAVFGYPLTATEIEEFLIAKNKTRKTKQEIILAIRKMKDITENNGYFQIKNLSSYLNNPKKFRKEREKCSREKIKLATKNLLPLGKVPSIKMVGITGSVAANNAKKNSDIDIFIICQKNTLWITRLVVVLYLKLKGVYFNTARPKNTICPNIYISIDRLNWPISQRNLYTAHEVVMLIPIISKGKTYERFIGENLWTKRYLPNHKCFKLKARLQTLNYKLSAKMLFAICYWLLDKILMTLQLKYMKKHGQITNEVLTRDLIHFKKVDSKNKVLDNYKKILERLNINSPG